MTGITDPARSRVLIVEDSLFTRTVLTTELQRAGYLVESADTFARALGLVMQNPPAVAVVDIFLGNGPSGLDLMRNLRNAPGAGSTFIIAISGHFAPDCLRTAREAGCDRFLVKPFATAVIVESIEQFLASRRQAAAK